MASLVLGAAGAVVGSFIGGPLGASIGWSLGAAAGNMLFPGKGQNGPRLTDLKLQNSQYGQMIPITFGTIRIAPQVIWQTDLVEHEHTEGGKGGGPEVTTFTYSASFALMLCEGPIGGVLRIWADSRLVWDPSSMDPDDFPFTTYLGTETQDVDPTMEAELGVGNVPAYRGRAMLVFSEFFLTDYGNRIPSFTVEVFAAGGPIPWRYSTFIPFNNASRAGPGGQGPQQGTIENGNLVLGFIEGTSGIDIVALPATYTVNTYDLQGSLISNDVSATMLGPAECSGISMLALGCLNNPHIAWGVGSPATGTSVLINAFYYDGTITASPIYDPTLSTNTNVLRYALDNMPVYANQAVYGCGGNIGAFVSKWGAPGGVVTGGAPAAYYILPGTQGGNAWTISVDDSGDVWLKDNTPSGANDALFHLDADLNFIESWTAAQLPAQFSGATSFTVWNGYLCFHIAAAGTPIVAYTIDPGGTFTLTDPGSTPGTNNPQNATSLGMGLVLVEDGIVSLQPRSEAVTLGSIVSALSVRAGLTTDQIDVSQLTDLVDGYVIANQADARTCIEPLQVAWPFDAVEHDVVVRFPRRGVDGIKATIDDIDLGAFVPPGDPPPLLTTKRIQEVDLPRIIDATFLNKDTDYQNGEERAQRLITTSDLTTSLQLPIVMDSDKAINVCEVLLYNSWIEREQFSIYLPRKWILLEPADVIRANGRTMRITRKTDQADGVTRIDALATSLSVYNHAAPAAEGVGMPGGGGTPPTSPPVNQLTDALLLDLPLIRDTDNAVGWYAAMAGHDNPTWAGATLFKSIDGGTSYTSELVSTTRDTFGDCSNTVGDFAGGNVFDEINSLTVVLSAGSGTLSSVTTLAILNGANMAAVGTPGTTGVRNIEIIQFRDATLIGTRTYKLTGLLRGRRGSEWMIGSHVAGEKFILLPTNVNVLGAPSELFLDRKYKAVTSGQTLASAAALDFANYGAAGRPYAPCNLGGGRETNGDLLLTWVRRTRIGGLWTPFVDVPLSESIERYRIRIFADGTYASTMRTDSVDAISEFTYLAADQTADFGSPSPVPVYWGVSQLGTFGYGTEARGAT